jgi:hypothetical protein
MAPEQDDAHARQLEALRGYVAKLGVQQNRPAVESMAPQPASQRQRRPSPALAAAHRRAGRGGAGRWGSGWGGRLVRRPAGRHQDRRGLGRDPAPHRDHHRPDGLAGVPDGGRPGQRDAGQRGQAAGALAEQDKILNDPANRDLTVAEVQRKLAVTEQAGSSESARFDRALDDYLKVVDQCDLRAP